MFPRYCSTPKGRRDFRLNPCYKRLMPSGIILFNPLFRVLKGLWRNSNTFEDPRKLIKRLGDVAAGKKRITRGTALPVAVDGPHGKPVDVFSTAQAARSVASDW